MTSSTLLHAACGDLRPGFGRPVADNDELVEIFLALGGEVVVEAELIAFAHDSEISS